MKKIAIIGAGLTGLTTAFYLKKNNIDVTLFESNHRIGGVIHTERKYQFIWETGPSTGVLGKPEAMELFEDLDALDITYHHDAPIDFAITMKQYGEVLNVDVQSIKENIWIFNFWR